MPMWNLAPFPRFAPMQMPGNAFFPSPPPVGCVLAEPCSMAENQRLVEEFRRLTAEANTWDFTCTPEELGLNGGTDGTQLPYFGRPFFFRRQGSDEFRGPFTERQMLLWYREAWFASDTEFRVGEEGHALTLAELMRRNGTACPFAGSDFKPSSPSLLDEIKEYTGSIVTMMEMEGKMRAQQIDLLAKKTEMLTLENANLRESIAEEKRKREELESRMAWEEEERKRKEDEGDASYSCACAAVAAAVAVTEEPKPPHVAPEPITPAAAAVAAPAATTPPPVVAAKEDEMQLASRRRRRGSPPMGESRSAGSSPQNGVTARALEVCEKCGGRGHTVRECLPDNRCFNCGQVDHKQSECTEVGLRRCYACGRAGHVAAYCRNKN